MPSRRRGSVITVWRSPAALAEPPDRTLIDVRHQTGYQKRMLGRACVDWRGQQLCGETAEVRVRAGFCRWSTVKAIFVKLPPEARGQGVVGNDYLSGCGTNRRR